MTTEELHTQALSEGYKDETCPRCGVEFQAHIHFIRCDANPCPMRSKANTKTLLQMLLEPIAQDKAP